MHSNTSRSLIKNEHPPEDVISVNSSKHHHQRKKSKGRLRKNSVGMKDSLVPQSALVTEKTHMTTS